MHHFRIGLLLSISLLGWAAPAVLAQNLGFLSKAPIAEMNEADQAMLRAAVNEALNDRPDGETLEWQNPDTGTGGTITVVDTHADYGTTCRTIRTATEAGGRSGAGIYRLCRAEDQTWQFAPRRKDQDSGE